MFSLERLLKLEALRDDPPPKKKEENDSTLETPAFYLNNI